MGLSIVASGQRFFNPGNGHTYFLTEPTTWDDAQGQALLEGGNLVTINDATEQDWLIRTFEVGPEVGGLSELIGVPGTTLVSDGEGLWIGLNDIAIEGMLQWASGQPLSYSPYQSGKNVVENQGSDSLFNYGDAYDRGVIESYGEWASPLWFLGRSDTSHRGIVEVEACTQILTRKQLQKIMPKARAKDIETYLDSLNSAMLEYGINTAKRQQAFIAQLAQESQSFRKSEEGLYYKTPKILYDTFKSTKFETTENPKTKIPYFKDLKSVEPYLRNPEKLGNYIYSKRLGNNLEGDGYKYRGRGLIQITGKKSYSEFKQDSGIDVVANPDLLLDPAISAEASAWYWNNRNLNKLADKGDFKQITKKINTAMLHLKERETFYNEAKKVINQHCPVKKIKSTLYNQGTDFGDSVRHISSALNTSNLVDYHGQNSVFQSTTYVPFGEQSSGL